MAVKSDTPLRSGRRTRKRPRKLTSNCLLQPIQVLQSRSTSFQGFTTGGIVSSSHALESGCVSSLCPIQLQGLIAIRNDFVVLWR